jgi:hypothetical protein
MGLIATGYAPYSSSKEILKISIQTKSLEDKKHVEALPKNTNNLVAKGKIAWKYKNGHGVLVLFDEVVLNASKACAIFEIGSGVAELIYGSDVHQSCRFVEKPKLIAKNGSYWINIPVEVDSTGESENFLPASVNLFLDKKINKLCLPDGAEKVKWTCSKEALAQYYVSFRKIK